MMRLMLYKIWWAKTSKLRFRNRLKRKKRRLRRKDRIFGINRFMRANKIPPSTKNQTLASITTQLNVVANHFHSLLRDYKVEAPKKLMMPK